MTQINDGGPAFPFVSWKSPDGMVGMDKTEGMSMRDWFAGQALPVILTELWSQAQRAGKTHAVGVDITASGFAYEVADAMLAARGAS